MNGHGPVRPRRQQDLLPLADYGSQGDVINGRGLVQPCRLQNLLQLGGARGDVMDWHWCDQAEIMETIASQGCLRGCYELALVTTRQRLWNLSPLGGA